MPVTTKIALTIAGSDSGGGAGIQADLKTFHQHGAFGTSVIVAVTAQNTLGVTHVHAIPTASVNAQMAALAADLPPAATKIGMLATAELVECVAAGVQRHKFTPLVLDPVLVATSGDRLTEAAALPSMKRDLFPLASLVTPNAREAAILTGIELTSPEALRRAGLALLSLGPDAVLLKGGHLGADGEVTDLLFTGNEMEEFVHPRIDTTSTHGTGCTLSAAIAAHLAHGHPLGDAVERSINWVHEAIRTAPALGRGHGPLNHFASET